MTKDELILAALATSRGGAWTPVQIQKLLFLLDERIPDPTGGPHFNFVPYHYGPFDPQIYYQLEVLEGQGLVEVYKDLSLRKYRLTPDGQEKGTLASQDLESKISQYIKELSDFVRSLTFSQLVVSIYREYPEMKANSVFQ